MLKTTLPKTTVIVIGTGGMARAHLQTMLEMTTTTSIVGFVEPSESARVATRALFGERGSPCPPFFDSIQELLKTQGSSDSALICTPHKHHLENAEDCLLAGIDVCLEKPMVMNVAEAQRLIGVRDESRRLVMVAYPGSLSPAIWEAKRLIARHAIGKVTAVSAFAHQDWQRPTTGTWRQNPEISGGGFLFDTGSHMVNTVVDLLGEDVLRVNALLDNRGTAVEIVSSISGVSTGGVLFSLTGVGDSVQCRSEITVFGDRGLLKTGIWGEALLVKSADDAEFKSVPHAASRGVWEQFLRVRAGELTNPCPPEIGLRFARLMDMIRQSAAAGKTVTANAA